MDTISQKNSISSQQATLLLGILSENLTNVATLNELLLIERSKLEKRERLELTEIIQQKAECIQKIQNTEGRLEQTLLKFSRQLSLKGSKTRQIAEQKQAISNVIDAHTIESIIVMCPTPFQKNLTNTWQQLKHELQECQFRNSINGQIIHKSKHNVETMLAMMRGYSQQIDLYHADGLKERSSEQRTLAKA